jgi:hypothetical protein
MKENTGIGMLILGLGTSADDLQANVGVFRPCMLVT